MPTTTPTPTLTDAGTRYTDEYQGIPMPVAAEETECAAGGKCEKNDVIDYFNDEERRRLVSNDLREFPGPGEPARSDGEIMMRLPDLELLMKRPRGGGLQPAAAAGDIMDGKMDGDGVKRKRASGGGWRRRAKTKRLHTSAETAGQAKIDGFCMVARLNTHTT